MDSIARFSRNGRKWWFICLTSAVIGGSFSLPQAQAADASLVVRVVDDDVTHQPVGRAIVTVRGVSTVVTRGGITADDGQCLFAGLPSGSVRVSVSKPGYLTTEYGAMSAEYPGISVALKPGLLATATVSLSKGAVVAGTIQGSDGAPAAGLFVFALSTEGSRANLTDRLMAASTEGRLARTSDDGSYRLFGLAPGTYVLAATAPGDLAEPVVKLSTQTVDEMLRLGKPTQGASVAPATASTTIAPIYYPGSGEFSSAARLRLAKGEEREGLNFVFRPQPVSRIAGIVVLDGGERGFVVQMAVTPASPFRAIGLASALPRLTSPPGPTGEFILTNVLPGHYTIMATGSRPVNQPMLREAQASNVTVPAGRGRDISPMERMYGVADVDVTDSDLSGVMIHLSRGTRMSGRILFDGERPVAPDLTKLRVGLVPTEKTDVSNVAGLLIREGFEPPAARTVSSDGTFELTDVPPGVYRVECECAEWSLKSAVANGADLLEGILFEASIKLLPVTLVLTNRRTELVGSLRTSDGSPAPGYFVIVFPVERQRWRVSSLRMKVARSGTDGVFLINELPAGDYFIAALFDVPPSGWQEREFLDAVVQAAVRVTVVEGQKTIQNLQIR